MLFASLWRIAYKNRYVTHPYILTLLKQLKKWSPTIDLFLFFFQKLLYSYQLKNRSLLLEHLEKKAGKASIKFSAIYRKMYL